VVETEQERRTRRVASLKSERTPFDTEWKDLARQVAPQAGRFLPSTDPNRDRNSLRGSILNPAAGIALRALSAGFMSGVTNPAMPWVMFKMADPDLNRYKPVKEWLDIAKITMMEWKLKSNIYAIYPKVYRDIGLFATGGMGIMETRLGDGIRATHFPIGSFCIGVDHEGRVNTAVREYKMTCEQMVGEFGKDKVSSPVKTAYERGNYDQWFDVVWMVEPNPKRREGGFLSKDLPFISIKWEPTEKGEPLSEKGYHEFPLMFPRWDVEGESAWGTDCPGMMAFGSTKSLQTREKEGLNALHKAVNPPMAGPVGMERPSLIPGSVTIEPQGPGQGFRAAVQIDPHYREMRESCAEVVQDIRSIFFSDLFLMLTNSTDHNKTAYEVAQLQQEKLQQLGPVSIRVNDELLDQDVMRTFGILQRAGALPPPPPEMQDAIMTIEYITTMSQALKSVGITGIERLYQFAGGLVPIFGATILDKFNTDESIDQYAERIGTPPAIVRDKKEVDTLRQDRAQQQQMAQMAQNVAGMAQVGKTLSETNVTDPSALTQIQAAMQGGGALPGASGVMASPMQGGVPNG